jgi:hypothetical protein
MKINVTANDIRLAIKTLGTKSVVSHCAVARAVRRRFPKSDVGVGFTSISIGNQHGKLPQEVTDQIYKIIDGEAVDPFSFELPELTTI